jgi:hypothetical protein
MKETLSSKYFDSIEQFLHEGVMSQVSYKHAIQTVHSESISIARNQQSVNPLIGRKPPVVSITERKLSRPFRTVLRQLRSTKCSMLRDYLLKSKAVDDDTRPECQSAPQSVLHLFSCPAFLTTLTPIDLWYHPVDAIRFIVNLPAFRSLPPLDIPPPRPPPEPDP